MNNYYKILDKDGNIIQIGNGPIGENSYTVITEEEYNSIREQMILEFVAQYVAVEEE
jgi:hypothetical protein